MTSPNAPLVSVVIPMRNGEPYIRSTLESVLTQEGCALEVVVVDDGSTDGSGQAAASMGGGLVRVVPGPCRGIAPSLNAGLAAARGRYVVRCDADDHLSPGRLARQAAFLDEHPEFAAVCGGFETMSDKGKKLAAMPTGDDPAEITDELRAGQTRTHFGTFMTRASVLEELGGARPYFNGVEDMDLQMRIGTDHRVWFEPEACYRYRLHGTSSTHVQPSAAREFLTETARVFARQRAAGEPDDLMKGRPPEPPADDSKTKDGRSDRQGILLGQAWREHGAGNRWSAIRAGWRACWQKPARLSVWASWCLLFIKTAGKKAGAAGRSGSGSA